MANRGKNIIKIPVNGKDVREAILKAGYSIRSISKKIGFGDRTLRDYLNRNEMPVLMLDALEQAIGDCVFLPGYKYTEEVADLKAMKDRVDYRNLPGSPLDVCECDQGDDKVNHPNHYTFGSIEVIDYIRDKMTPDEFQGYCMGNILKYVSRHKHKNGVEDLKKAQVYLGWLIESEEGAK